MICLELQIGKAVNCSFTLIFEEIAIPIILSLTLHLNIYFNVGSIRSTMHILSTTICTLATITSLTSAVALAAQAGNKIPSHCLAGQLYCG